MLHQIRLCAVPKPAVTIDPLWDKSSFVASIKDAKPVLIQNRFWNLPHQKRLCACSKTGFVPTLNQPLQNRFCACSRTGFVPTLNQPLQNRLYACSKTSFVPTLNLPHQNWLCIGTKPAFSFWINISTVPEVRCDCQGLGLVACIEASILVFDTKQVLYWPVLEQIQFCSFDRRCKTCLDTKPVLYQGRFWSLTYVVSIYSSDTRRAIPQTNKHIRLILLTRSWCHLFWI